MVIHCGYVSAGLGDTDRACVSEVWGEQMSPYQAPHGDAEEDVGGRADWMMGMVLTCPLGQQSTTVRTSPS